MISVVTSSMVHPVFCGYLLISALHSMEQSITVVIDSRARSLVSALWQ